MKRFVRTFLLFSAITAISTGPALAFECAIFLSGYHQGELASGHLRGYKRVTLTAGAGAYIEASFSESFCVGTYDMLGRNGRTFVLQIRCDTYSVWGMF